VRSSIPAVGRDQITFMLNHSGGSNGGFMTDTTHLITGVVVSTWYVASALGYRLSGELGSAWMRQSGR